MLNTGIVRDSMLSNGPHYTVGLSDIAIFENYILTTLYPNAQFLEQIDVFNDSLELIKLDPLRDSFRTVYGHSQFVTTKNKLPKIYSLTARWNDSVFFPSPYSSWHKNLSIIHMDTAFSLTAIDTFQHNRNIDDTIGWTTPYAHFGSIDWNTNGDTAVFMGTNFEF